MKKELFERIYERIGELTPLDGHDCGQLCERACCRGGADSGFGMRLFPGEETTLEVIENENGRFAVCGGSCGRSQRPLACRLFPLYPAPDGDGGFAALIDGRGARLCPLVRCCDDVIFSGDFLDAVEDAGKLLAQDAECAEEMSRAADEIMAVNRLVFGEDDEEEE